MHTSLSYTQSPSSNATPRARLRAAFVAATLLAGVALRARAQGADVRINVQNGAVARLPVQCEALQGAAGGPASSRDADQVLANDLTWSGVFSVNRMWNPDAAAPAPQFVSSGTWSVSGSSVKLHGELRDFPARRAILVEDYTGTVAD